MKHMTHYIYYPPGGPAYDLKDVAEDSWLSPGYCEIAFADPGLGRMVAWRAEVSECTDEGCLHNKVVNALEAARFNGELAFTHNLGRADAERRVWLAVRNQ